MAAQPDGRLTRHMHVIAHPAPRPERNIAIDLALRVLAITLVTLLILGILPVITEAVA